MKNKGTLEYPYCDKSEYKGWTIYIHFHKEADPRWYDFFRYTRVKGEKVQGCGGHFKTENQATKAAMEWIDYDERIIESTERMEKDFKQLELRLTSRNDGVE